MTRNTAILATLCAAAALAQQGDKDANRNNAGANPQPAAPVVRIEINGNAAPIVAAPVAIEAGPRKKEDAPATERSQNAAANDGKPEKGSDPFESPNGGEAAERARAANQRRQQEDPIGSHWPKALPHPPKPLQIRTYHDDTAEAIVLRFDDDSWSTEPPLPELAWKDVWRITRQSAPPTTRKPPDAVVHLRNGRLRVASVTLDDRFLEAPWRDTELCLPLDTIHAVVLSTAGADELIRRALTQPAPNDRLVARAPDGPPVTLPGTLEAITGDAVRFRYRDRDRSVAIAKVAAVIRAEARSAAPPEGIRIRLADDEFLLVDHAELHERHLHATIAEQPLCIPWDAVAAIEKVSPRVLYLSDLQPLRVDQHTTLAVHLPWQADRNCRRRPMELFGQPVERGIGVHAENRLAFAIPPAARTFAARVGLDSVAGAGGDCIASVHIDGEEQTRHRLLPDHPPVPIRIACHHAAEIVLRVDPGDDYDLGDAVNWADARFLF